MGLFIASDNRAVIMVHPADGPSFGVAPYRQIHDIMHSYILLGNVV